MAKSKNQKNTDLEELTSKLKEAKSVVFTDYRGTTVKDLDKFRNNLRKEQVFSKVYKVTLVRKAMEAIGLDASSVNYKTPVILSVSRDEETAPARIIKTLAKDVKTLSILEGIVDGKVISKAQVEALGDLPGKDQLRAQFLSVLNGPMAAFARLLDAYGKKKNEGSAPAAEQSAAAVSQAEAVLAPAEAPEQSAPADAAPAAA